MALSSLHADEVRFRNGMQAPSLKRMWLHEKGKRFLNEAADQHIDKFGKLEDLLEHLLDDRNRLRNKWRRMKQ